MRTEEATTPFIGSSGPILPEDYHLVLVEKIANFDRERIPERVVHAQGASARQGLLRGDPRHLPPHPRRLPWRARRADPRHRSCASPQ
jgi:hypothetical protein